MDKNIIHMRKLIFIKNPLKQGFLIPLNSNGQYERD